MFWYIMQETMILYCVAWSCSVNLNLYRYTVLPVVYIWMGRVYKCISNMTLYKSKRCVRGDTRNVR